MRRALAVAITVVGLILGASGCLVAPLLSDPASPTGGSSGDRPNGQVRSLGLLQEALLQVPDLPAGTTLARPTLLPSTVKLELASDDPACAPVVLRTGPNLNAKLADVSLLLSPDHKGVLGEWLRTAPSTEAVGSLVAHWGAAAGSSCAKVRVMVGGQTQVDGTLAPGPALPAAPGARSVRLNYTVDGSNRSQTIVAAGVTDVLMVLVFDGLPDDLVVDVTAKAIGRARAALAA